MTRIVWNPPGYGKFTLSRGGKVTISSLVDGAVRKRRVGIHPAFDPNALTMTPLPGWTAASSAVGKAA
jgi:hypothetical protein